MKKKVLLLIVLLIVISCTTDNRKDKEYYSEGELKAIHYLNERNEKDSSNIFYKDGNLMSFIKYSGDKKVVKNYFQDGNIKSKGDFIDDTIPIGVWSYYYENGKLKEVKEFMKIDGKGYLNQNWVFNKYGDTLFNKSSFYDLLIEKDTININEPIKAKLDLVGPYFKDINSSIMVILPRDNSENFNSDFSNYSKVVKDTTYNLNLEVEIRKALELKSDFRKTAIFGRYFNVKGKNLLRGVLVEYYYKDSTDRATSSYFEVRKYFERLIYVE